jgi:hypothetical protein
MKHDLDRIFTSSSDDDNRIQNFYSKYLLEETLGRPRHTWEHNLKIYVREAALKVAVVSSQDDDRSQWEAFVRTAKKTGSKQQHDFVSCCRKIPSG